MSLAERLKRLRGEAGAAQLPRAADPDLRSLIAARARRLAPAPLAPPAGREIATGVQLVERVVPWPAEPTLDVPLGAGERVDRERLVAFDTETTGLAGGVGTRAFMVGLANWRHGELRLRQLYLTRTAGEHAMLRLFTEWLPPDGILVSYNGKSYDAPLLKGRLRLNRIAHHLDAMPHLDLLHPVRRRYRGVYANCRLATIEREVLRIMREDDLPGSEAPAAWLAYLRGESSRNLGRVIAHNAQDIISLMRLVERL